MSKSFATYLFAALLVTASFTSLSGQTLSQVDRGWYDESGTHNIANDNYGVSTSYLGTAYRNWFVFDLSSINYTIGSATATLFNPAQNTSSGVYEVFSVEGDLTSLMNGTGGVAAFNDLGSGSSYVSYTVDPVVDSGSFVSLEFNQAALNSMNNSSGLWAFGGSFTLDASDGLFLGWSGGASNLTTLTLNAVPEISTSAIILALGAIGVAYRRRKNAVKLQTV